MKNPPQIPSGPLPPYEYVEQLNGWGSRVKLHWWGVQLGPWSCVWWDLWTRSACFQISRVRSTPDDTSTHIPTGTGWPS